jgi:hypothetical protein
MRRPPLSSASQTNCGPVRPLFQGTHLPLQISVLDYNLGNLWWRLGPPSRINSWSLTSLQHRLMKTGGRLIKDAPYYCLLLAEGHLNRKLFGQG